MIHSLPIVAIALLAGGARAADGPPQVLLPGDEADDKADDAEPSDDPGAATGATPDEEQTGGEQTGGEQTNGEQTNGEQTNGEQTGREQTNGEQTNGEQTGGEQTGGEQTGGERPARAEPDGAEPDPVLSPLSDPLAPYRTRFDVLVERAIGTTSRPVEFNWRRSPAQIALTGSYLSELNNFNGLRVGAAVRLPMGGVLMELGASYAAAWDSPSSRLLALTPYRQPGHPDRMELDFAFGFPLAEGIVTTFPGFFPAVQMVFSAYGGLRYLLYPTGFAGMQLRQITGAVFSPSLTDMELENLDSARLASMQIDLGRYGLMLGLSNDLYFKNGLFLSPRVLLAVPLLAPATETELLMWADISLAIGVAL